MSEFPIKSALVTGASGFVGEPLCRRLQSLGVAVRAAGRRPTSGPWNDFKAMDLATGFLPPSLMDGIDTVFHLAGKAHSTVRSTSAAQEHQTINFHGTKLILEAALEGGVKRFVLMSTVKASAGDSPYSRSKLLAEQLVLGSCEEGMHAVVLRPALIYGPGWKGNLQRMAVTVASGRFPPLPELRNRRSMIHVDDVVSAAILAAEHPDASGRIYVVTDGQAYSTRRIYLAMCSALGRKVPTWTIPMFVLRLSAVLGDFFETVLRVELPINSEYLQRLTQSEYYDSSRIREELGWRPQHVLETAINEILASRPSRFVDAAGLTG